MADDQSAATRPSTGSRGPAPFLFDGGKIYTPNAAKVLGFFFLIIAGLGLVFDPLLKPTDRHDEYNQFKNFKWSPPNCGQDGLENVNATFPWDLTFTSAGSTKPCGASLLTPNMAVTTNECCALHGTAGGTVNGQPIDNCLTGAGDIALIKLKTDLSLQAVCLHSPRFSFRWGTLRFQGYAKWIPDARCRWGGTTKILSPEFKFCPDRCLAAGSGLYSRQLDRQDRFYLVGVVKDCVPDDSNVMGNMTAIRLNDHFRFLNETISGAMAGAESSTVASQVEAENSGPDEETTEEESD